jgi:nucleoside-diphosphate-sugar epimerase
MICEIEWITINKIHQLNEVQGVRTRHSDNTKIYSLWWKPKISLEEGLKKLNKYVK